MDFGAFSAKNLGHETVFFMGVRLCIPYHPTFQHYYYPLLSLCVSGFIVNSKAKILGP